jgi:UDP-N-acetyl-D-mannosaminuronate dehydrogenase
MHLCFPFTRQADFEELALSYIGRFKPELTIINSTVIPGTSRAIAERSSAPIAYSPVRGKHVCMAQDLLKYRKFVAGSDDDATNRAAAHFRSAGMNTQCISKLETLELAKLAETTYFGVLIAFAQELNRYADRTDGDYAEALRHSKHRVAAHDRIVTAAERGARVQPATI